jgi:hypothetical protein
LNIKASGLPNIMFQELDWTEPSPIVDFPDLIVMSDLITWPELYDPLINALESMASTETMIVFSHESRNFEKEAQFYAKLSKSFSFNHLKSEELDERYQSEDIYVFTASKK